MFMDQNKIEYSMNMYFRYSLSSLLCTKPLLIGWVDDFICQISKHLMDSW